MTRRMGLDDYSARALVRTLASAAGCEPPRDEQMDDRGIHYVAEGAGAVVYAPMSATYVTDALRRTDTDPAGAV